MCICEKEKEIIRTILKIPQSALVEAFCWSIPPGEAKTSIAERGADVPDRQHRVISHLFPPRADLS